MWPYKNKLDNLNCGSCTRDKRGFTEKSLKPEEVQRAIARRIADDERKLQNYFMWTWNTKLLKECIFV